MDYHQLTIEQLKRMRSDIDKEIRKRSKSESRVNDFRKVWEDFCISNDLTYYWTAKDAGCAKQLLKKMEFEIQNSGKQSDVIEATKVFIQIAYQDKWLKENWEVCMVNSRFNSVVNQARNTVKRKTNIDELLD